MITQMEADQEKMMARSKQIVERQSTQNRHMLTMQRESVRQTKEAQQAEYLKLYADGELLQQMDKNQ